MDETKIVWAVFGPDQGGACFIAAFDTEEEAVAFEKSRDFLCWVERREVPLSKTEPTD